ncbi:MAG: HAD family phosphatase [Bacteroidota bacterium]
MPEIKHLIFDCDGVLVDSEYVAVNIMLRLLKPYGYTASFEEFSSQFTGMLDTAILAHLREHEGLPLPDDFYHQIESERDRAYLEEIEAVPGMPALIKSLKIPKSVVSNSHVFHVKLSLKICGLEEVFGEYIYSSEHVAHPKPHPDVYLHALASRNLSPQEVLVIEDSLTGVQAATSAGCKVIGFAGARHVGTAHMKKLASMGVEQVAASAHELEKILGAYL